MQIFYKIDQNEELSVGDQIKVEIDKETRIKNAKLHSAGHVIDLAVQRLSKFLS